MQRSRKPPAHELGTLNQHNHHRRHGFVATATVSYLP